MKHELIVSLPPTVISHTPNTSHSLAQVPVARRSQANRCDVCKGWFVPLPAITVVGVVSREEITYTIDDIPGQMASDVLSCQDACNLGGVFHSADRVISELQIMSRVKGCGTDWVSMHPVIALYLEKFAHLNGATLDHPKSVAIYLLLEAAAKAKK